MVVLTGFAEHQLVRAAVVADLAVVQGADGDLLVLDTSKLVRRLHRLTRIHHWHEVLDGRGWSAEL